jgi:hypothetical protein
MANIDLSICQIKCFDITSSTPKGIVTTYSSARHSTFFDASFSLRARKAKLLFLKKKKKNTF